MFDIFSFFIYCLYIYDLFHHVVWLSLVHPVNPQEKLHPWLSNYQSKYVIEQLLVTFTEAS